MTAHPVIAPQPFETGVLGVPVLRLALARRTTRAALEAHAAEWRRDGVWLVAARIPEAWVAEAKTLTGAGFRAIETLITYRRPVGRAPAMPSSVRPAVPTDRQTCVAIAARSFGFDRFHADPLIPAAAADRLKAAWVANDLDGRADSALVAGAGGDVVGFVLCLRVGGAAVIDLIAVAPEAQGMGHGGALLAGALAAHSGREMRAGTQAANAASRRLYEAAGFTLAERASTFHWINPAVRP